MNRTDLESELIRILRKSALGGSQRPVSVDAPLGESGLGLDSLSLLRFVLEVENSFGIAVPNAMWDRRGQHTVRSFAKFVARLEVADSIPAYEPESAPQEKCTACSPRAGEMAGAALEKKRAGLFENLREDLRRARVENVGPGWWSQNIKFLLFPGMLGVLNYRFCHWVRSIRIPIVSHLFLLPAGISRALTVALTGINISPNAQIGPGLVIHTNYGILVSPTKIGANCILQTGVLIGYGVRKIGDNVYFGPGAKVVGDVTIGDNVVIAPNSLVMSNVPDNTTVLGVPARIQLPRNQPLTFGFPSRKEEPPF
jgi:serine O-acetyltransferase